MEGTKTMSENARLYSDTMLTYEFTMNIMISIGIGIITVLLVLYYFVSKKKVEVSPMSFVGFSKPRFRKRDKVLFYGRKMLRKVRSFTKNTMRDVNSQSGRNRASRKRQLVVKLAKKLLRFQKDEPQLRVREPPDSFLEVDLQQSEFSETRLPAEVMYMLRSVRVLGHFEQPLFLELCKYMESRFVPQGSFIFRVGEPDDSIYVLQSGKVNVIITEQDGTEHCVKEVNPGDSIHSLLSILDILTGHPAPYKTVSALAVADSTILRLPALAFQTVLERYPESLVRVVQIIMVRLQRVTFMALHNYLGLSNELINPESQSDKRLSVHQLGASPKGSPTKQSRENIKSTSGEDNVSRQCSMNDTDGSDIWTEPKRKATPAINIPRKSMDVGSGRGRCGSLPVTTASVLDSDFDAACNRARVEIANPVEEVFPGSASPNKHSIPAEDTPPNYASGRKNRRTINIDEDANVVYSGGPYDSISSTDRAEQLMEVAKSDIAKLFGLEDNPDLLEGKLILRHIKAGTTLIKQGDQDASLIFVVTGTLQVLQQMIGNWSDERQRPLFLVKPGEIVDSLAVLTGEPSFFTIRAKKESRVVTISKQGFYSIMKEQPQVVLNVGHTVVKRMSPFVRQIDFALDWMQIEAGRALFRQGERSDCIYIVLNGRLRSVIQKQDGKKELVGEYGRGELVGLVEVVTQTERATTIMAVRDTELAQIPEELLNMIKRKYPQIVTRLIHLLGQRILGTLQNRPTTYSVLSEHPNLEPRGAAVNLATVAVLPVADDVPLHNFTLELQFALKSIGETLRLTSDLIQARLGSGALDSVNEYRLQSWLGQQEDIHRMVLYQCDYRMTPWTQRCIRQADAILIVAMADQEPTVGKLEKQLETFGVRAQKELILLHREDSEEPTRTIEWLNARGWCSSHHHIKCPNRVFSRKPQIRMTEYYKKLMETEPDRMTDFSRLARFLTGTAVGLILGGGGARGCAHVGIIKAMMEAGIPIDMVGGVSIGSLMGGLWCAERNITRVTQKAREWALEMASLWKKIFDLTYPVAAMFSGAVFNRSIQSVIKDKQIEDLWIPYFCVTTDITASRMRVHTSGSLWRYVRASMSLSGYLPPLCDPCDGHLLLDGGYVNNLPADVMKAMGVRTIFAVDVGSEDDSQLSNYGDELSGWWLLWKRWNPWAKPVRVLNMAEIQSRLAYVSCVRQLEEVKNSDFCEYIRPPIVKYGTLQFGYFDEINDVGYNHGKTLFSAWAKKDVLNKLFHEDTAGKVKPLLHKTRVPAEADFTDLAELVSRIDEPRKSRIYHDFDGMDEEDEIEDYDDDEYEDDDDCASTTSEPPPVTLSSPKVRRKTQAFSAGASPATTPVGSPIEKSPLELLPGKSSSKSSNTDSGTSEKGKEDVGE